MHLLVLADEKLPDFASDNEEVADGDETEETVDKKEDEVGNDDEARGVTFEFGGLFLLVRRKTIMCPMFTRGP